jgi:hypothetical protein
MAMSHHTVKRYEPINKLKQIGEDIWIVDGPIAHGNIRNLHIKQHGYAGRT